MNILNKKTILFFSISSLMLNGCVSKNEATITPVKQVMKTKKFKMQSSWGKVASVKSSKKDCVDCYAAPVGSRKPPVANNNLYSKVLEEPTKKSYKSAKVAALKGYGTYLYEEKMASPKTKVVNYGKRKITPAVSPMNTSYGSYTTAPKKISYKSSVTPINTYASEGNIAIQVGAFNKYANANKTVGKYSHLNNQYKVAIRTGMKNNKSLHRVRIEGFKSKSQAKQFMDTYGIRDGFLVRN